MHLGSLATNVDLWKPIRPAAYIIYASLCSGLYFTMNVNEKIVANRLGSHIYTNDLSDVSQSAYKPFLPQKLLS